MYALMNKEHQEIYMSNRSLYLGIKEALQGKCKCTDGKQECCNGTESVNSTVESPDRIKEIMLPPGFTLHLNSTMHDKTKKSIFQIRRRGHMIGIVSCGLNSEDPKYRHNTMTDSVSALSLSSAVRALIEFHLKYITKKGK